MKFVKLPLNYEQIPTLSVSLYLGKSFDPSFEFGKLVFVFQICVLEIDQTAKILWSKWIENSQN